MKPPKELGYSFPAEWEKHAATWLSWPHKEASWPGKLNLIFPVYAQFIKAISKGEKVKINVNDANMEEEAKNLLVLTGVEMDQVEFFHHPTNDAWCRDHGPAFLIREQNEKNLPAKVIVDWGFNSWGEKYPPHDLDDKIPTWIANHYKIPCYHPGIIMEGGSVEFNGAGTVLTTRSCLLNPNRNPQLTEQQIEQFLKDYYGVDQVLWLEKGIEGDDTDGHIDDLTRFVNKDTVVTILPDSKSHPDYTALKANLEALQKMRLQNGEQLNIVELPVPPPLFEPTGPLPASYANFYICNAAVIVPLFNDPHDQLALDTLAQCFKDRAIIGLDSRNVVWGLGSFHCLSQQEPEAIA